MVWGLAIGAASTLASGLIGGSDAREAERLNRENMQAGLADFDGAFGALDDAEMGALTDLDYANDILSGIEPAVLNSLDESLRIRVAQQVRQNQEVAANQQAQLANAGLDVTTVGAGLQRSLAFGQAQQIGEMGAAYGGQRAGAIASARGNLAQGFANRAGMQAQFGQARASAFQNRAGYRQGFQFEAPNTGAMIGQIGGMIGNAVGSYESGLREDRYIKALEAMGGGS